MSFKSFLLKKTLQLKGMPKDQAELFADKIANDPNVTNALKALEENKEVKDLFETIQKEIEEKKKGGMPEQYAAMNVMMKHKDQIAKHREELMPLMQLMQGMKTK